MQHNWSDVIQNSGQKFSCLLSWKTIVGLIGDSAIAK